MDELDACGWIEWSLERLGEADIDITPQVYELYFRDRPECVPYFRMASTQTMGRMLSEAITVLTDLADGRAYVDGIIQVTVCDHTTYGPIRLADYAGFTNALKICTLDALSAAGASPFELAACDTARQAQIDHLISLIDGALQRLPSVQAGPSPLRI